MSWSSSTTCSANRNRSMRLTLLLLVLSLAPATTAYRCHPQRGRRRQATATFGATPEPRCVPVPSPTAAMALVMASSRSVLGRGVSPRTPSALSERTPGAGSHGREAKRKKRPCACPDDNNEDYHFGEDDDSASLEDRREALVAALGGAWALAAAAGPRPALAVAGTDANMAFPDVIGGMNDRATKQCLVESLGNRECLVYKETDPDKLLYKGIDGAALVSKIQKAAGALEKIPPLVDQTRWNDVTGLLTGPMGELSSTLTLLAAGDPSKTKLARKVKEDLFAMGTAATQRKASAVLEHHEAATRDLARFLEAAL